MPRMFIVSAQNQGLRSRIQAHNRWAAHIIRSIAPHQPASVERARICMKATLLPDPRALNRAEEKRLAGSRQSFSKLNAAKSYMLPPVPRQEDANWAAET